MKNFISWAIIIIIVILFWILATIGLLSLFSKNSFEFKNPGPIERQKDQTVLVRIVTAYTASPDETDDTPCEGALAGIDFCNPPYPLIATNELPLESIVEIDGIEYLVADRTNKRYSYRYDILVGSKTEAYAWGHPIKEIIIK